MPGEELPPVVAVFQANIKDLVAGIEQAMGWLKKVDGKEATALLGADGKPLQTAVAEADAELDALGSKVVEPTIRPKVDDSGVASFLDVQRAQIANSLGAAATSTDMRTAGLPWWASVAKGNIGWDTQVARWRQMSGRFGGQFATDAQLAALLASLTASERSSLPADALSALGAVAGGSGGGGRLGGVASLIAAAGGGRGGGIGGILRAFGMGSSAIPFLGGLAGFGTLASLLGFGAEHAIFTGLGVAGSAGAGLLGGGLLGLGSLGVAGVGMGTDLAGIGQAAGDIKQAYTIMGNSALTAAQKQQQLNQALGDLTPAARAAVMSAAGTATQFHLLFDQATGAAEATGAKILQQAMVVGEKFLPTIGEFAAKNMGIIQRSLQPFFAWLTNPSGSGGLGIFTDLEREFTRNLPTAMDALTQGFELIAKTIDVASHYTGGFIATIDRFVNKWNGIDFNRWAGEIGHLIGVFRTWWDFIKQIGITIYDVFAPAVGLGTSIIAHLTNGLKDLDHWLTSSKIRSELHNLFDVHMREMIQGIGGLIKGLLPIAESFMSVFIQWSTQGAGLMTLILKPLTDFVKLVSSNAVTRTLAGWGLMIGLVVSKVGPLVALVGGLAKAWGAAGAASVTAGREFVAAGAEGAASARAAGGIAVGTDLEAAFAATAPGRFAGLKGALGKAGMFAQGIMGAAGLGMLGAIGGSALAGATETTNQHKRLARDLTTAGGGLLGGGLGLMQVNPLAGGIVAGVGALTMAAGEIVNHWKGISKFFADDVWHPLRAGAVRFWHDIDNDVIHPITRLPSDLGHWFETGLAAVGRFFSRLPGQIVRELAALPRQLAYLAGESIGLMLRGLVDGVKLVYNFWTQFVPHVLKLLAGWGVDLLKLGLSALKMMWQGITAGAVDLWNFWTSLPGKVIHFIASLPSQLSSSGHGAVHSMWQGITGAAVDIWNFFTSLPGKVLGFLSKLPGDLYNFGRTIIQKIIDGVASMGGAFASGIKNALGGALNGIPVIGGIAKHLGLAASGTTFAAGGLTLVGEHGPELVQLPRGARVSTNSSPATRRAMSAQTGGRTMNLTINMLGTTTDPHTMANDILFKARPSLAGLAH